MIFVLSAQEFITYKEWEKEHRETCVKTKRDKTQSMSFTFSPTSLGDAVSVKCHWCKEEKDLSDYNSW